MKPLHPFKTLLSATLVVGVMAIAPAGLGAAWAQGKAGRLVDTPVSHLPAAPPEVFAVPIEPATVPDAARSHLDTEPETLSPPPRAAVVSLSTAAQAAATTATIRGSVFYNDRRTDGLFAARLNKNGNPGQRCSVSGKRDKTSAACSLNWLAGKYMVVDVIERDMPVSPKVAAPGCKTEELLTSATVASDGTFSATFGTNDPCTNDLLANSAIELRVRLRFCNSSYCFSINRSMGNPYTVSHPDASASKPLIVKAGANITVSTLNFSTAADPSKPNNDSIAANYYASIVDTVLALHKDSTIPFYKEEFGEIQYIFPSTTPCVTFTSREIKTSTATACSPTEIVISSYQSQPESTNFAFTWVDGKTPAHEYGHVMMQRAWDGAYGFDGIGISAGSTTIAPSQQIAFKEAWAEFIARVGFPLTRGCSLSGYDDNGALAGCSAITQALAALEEQRQGQVDLIKDFKGGSVGHLEDQLDLIEAQIAVQEDLLDECKTSNTMTNLPGALGEGAMWRDNVTKALCDWYDDRDDNDRRLAGTGDHFHGEDIYSMWFNLRRMRLDAALYGGKVTNPGLWFCDYVGYYLNVRKSAAEVGATAHASYETEIRDLIYNNNIGCSMAAPQ